ncbi:MAG: ExbD/TolR family protein [Kiritimatiellia bacterium]
MNFRRHLHHTDSPLLQSVSLLTVVWLLLGLFLVGLLLAPAPREAGVWLAVAGNDPEAPQPADKMLIEIDRSGALSMNRQALTKEELREGLVKFSHEIADSMVLVRANSNAPLMQVLDVLDACRKADIDHYRVTAVPDEH